MFFKAATVFAILCSLLHGGFCATRAEVIAEYQPILIEHSTNLTTEYTTIGTEVTVAEQTLLNDTLTTITMMNTQITTLKSTIAAAKKTAANKTTVLNCIKPQETAATYLTAAPINTTCWVGANFTVLAASGKNFLALASIPNATIPACTNLDPLIPYQDDQFMSCITDKLLDFQVQLNALKSDFVDAKDATLKDGIQCLADQGAVLAQQISEINFQVTLCLTLG